MHIHKMVSQCNKLKFNYGMAIFIYSVSMAATAPTHSDKCNSLMQLDCTRDYVPEPNETVCCTDGQTYGNLCSFAQAKCKDASLEVRHTGICESSTPTPGDSNALLNNGTTEDPTSDIIHGVFCDYYDQIDCGNDLDPVCGSDDIFYKNNCEFAKAKCKYPSLSTQDLNICKTARRSRRAE